MRATFGRVAVVLLLSLGICGCKTGSNMFGWGKKKPDNSSLSEAPPYKPGNPALPSTGQTPTGLQTNVPGTGLASSQASANPGAAANGAYSSMPAGYQQSTYPTTPYTPPKLGATATASGATPAAGSMAAAAHGGYAAAVGTGSPLPPASGYVPGAGGAANPSQPQNGFYNPAYGGVGSNSSPSAYAATAGANPAYNYNAPAASTASAMAPSSTPEYRVADVRGGASQSSPAVVAGVVAQAPAANNSTVGDRYSNMSSSNVGDRYSPSAATAAPAATSMPPAVSAPMTAPPITAPASGAGDRYPQATNNDYYRPSASSSAAATSYSAPETSTAPAATSNPLSSESPLRKDSTYRPGGTSDFAPAGNSLRPTTNSDSGESQSNSQTSHTVTPVSYQSSTSGPALISPAVATAPPTGDRYGAYQGTAPSAEPAYGASSPATAQSGAYPEHSW